MTTRECILRELVPAVEVGLDTEGSPAVGTVRCDDDAAAAIGREKRERKRDEVARRKVEANTLTVGGFVAC